MQLRSVAFPIWDLLDPKPNPCYIRSNGCDRSETKAYQPLVYGASEHPSVIISAI